MLLQRSFCSPRRDRLKRNAVLFGGGRAVSGTRKWVSKTALGGLQHKQSHAFLRAQLLRAPIQLKHGVRRLTTDSWTCTHAPCSYLSHWEALDMVFLIRAHQWLPPDLFISQPEPRLIQPPTCHQHKYSLMTNAWTDPTWTRLKMGWMVHRLAFCSALVTHLVASCWVFPISLLSDIFMSWSVWGWGAGLFEAFYPTLPSNRTSILLSPTLASPLACLMTCMLCRWLPTDLRDKN